MDDLLAHFTAAARPGRGEENCSCCRSTGEHDDRSECDRCDGSGRMHRGDDAALPWCPGREGDQPAPPKRRHWREKTAGDVSDYGIHHRPLSDGAPAHDLTEGYSEDIYTHPQYWAAHNPPERDDLEGLTQLRRARGKPEAKVHIYRASHKDAPHEINTGDWVTLSKTYAHTHAYNEAGTDDPGAQYAVHHAVVPAKHVRDGGTDYYREQGYWGPSVGCCGHSKTAVLPMGRPEYGPEPEYDFAPEDWPPEKRDVHNQRMFDKRTQWKAGIKRGLSLGHLTAPEAKAHGYYFGGHETDDRNDPKWAKLPHEMYHVTTDEPSVRQHGLKTRAELSQQRGGHGLGGGEDDTISFTTDHHMARNILRAMHEFHGVVNGTFTPKQMWDQAKAGHGADRPFHEDIAHYWDSKWKDGDELPRGLHNAIHEVQRDNTMGSSQEMIDKVRGPGWHPARDDEGWMSGHKPPQKMHAWWEKEMDPDQRRENAASLYKHFAVHRQVAGGAEDPMFFATDTKAFAAKDPKHFALLHVRPRPGAQGYPVSSMSEWRTGTGDAVEVHHSEHAEPQQHHEGSGVNFEPYSRLKFRTSAWEKTSGPVPAAERTESVAHMLAHYKPYDFDTWDEVRHNINWDHPSVQSFVADVARNGVKRPIPVDYEQDPPQVRNGHTRLLAAERAGIKHVPARQHEGFMDPDDPDHLGRGPDDPGHWTNQDHWNEREGAFEYRHQHEAVDEDDGDAMHELDHPDARMYPPDVYDHPEMYGAKHYETLHALRKARGDPEARIRIYRALPKPHRAINKGDWVTTSKDYALQHAEQSNPHENWPVIRTTVPAKHLRTEGNELEEWAYHGPSTSGMMSHPGGQQGDKGGPASKHRWTQKEFYGKGWLEEAEESRRHEGALGPEIGFQEDYHGRHRVWAAGEGGLEASASGYGGSAGELHWHPERGTITYLNVPEGHQRQGIATALYRRAQAEAAARGLAAPVHSSSLSPGGGEAWARSTGDPLPPKEGSADFHAVTAWGERKPHAAAIHEAQEDTRLDHPAMTVQLPEPRWTGFSDDADHSLRHMLRRAGYPEHLAAGAWVHRKPEEATASSTAWDPGDGTVGVGLHPRRWDYGTMAHEAAHLLTNHQKGIPPDVMGQSLGLTDADVHDQHFADNYEHVIRTSWGNEAGDNFRRHHGDAKTLVSNYRARVHGLPRIDGGPLQHEAVLPMPGMRNPHTGGSEWFHGTRAHPDELSEGGFTDPMEMDEGAYSQPESETEGTHWNALLGTHFTADHDVAKEFALGEHSSGANSRGGEEPWRGESRNILHARLGLRNPKVYASEHDMDHEAYEHEWKAGNHPSEHIPVGSDDEDERHEMEDMWNTADRLHRQYKNRKIPRSAQEGSSGGRSVPHPVRTQWINSHPDKWGIANRFRKRLQEQGHDGIVYGNEYEHSHHGEQANKSAIVFDPARIQVTQHHGAYEDHLSAAEGEHQQARLPGPGQMALPFPFERAGARRKPLQPDQHECWKCGVRAGKDTFTKASPYAPVMGLAMECTDKDACRARREARHTAAVFVPTERIFGPTYGLDHRLFTKDEQLKPEVRQALLGRLQGVLEPVLGQNWDAVTRVCLAGSEASRWTSPELVGNGDLDVLIGVAYSYARKEAPALARLTDLGIDKHLNALLQQHFNAPGWHPPFGPDDTYDLTGYVNHHALDIRAINPYAAYDLTNGEWAVKPPDLPAWSAGQFPQGPAVMQEARALIAQVRAVLRLPEPFRTQEAVRIWDSLHAARGEAFSPGGLGWQGTGNVLEKALDQASGKLVEKLKQLKYGPADHTSADHAPMALGHGMTTADLGSAHA